MRNLGGDLIFRNLCGGGGGSPTLKIWGDGPKNGGMEMNLGHFVGCTIMFHKI